MLQGRFELAFEMKIDPRTFLDYSLEDMELTRRCWNNYVDRKNREQEE
ncbi:MAG: hypothetical protein ACK5NU_09575 [Fusobacterium ulcerans]